MWLFEFEFINSCLDVDAMIMYMNWKIICCWWCFETCCWWIGVMSMPIGELMMKVIVVVEYLWKFGELLNFDKMMF